MPSRIEMLKSFIAQRPEDPFPQYGLALEYKNAGELAAAWETFRALIEAHGDYVASYLHAGNTLVALGRPAEARAVFEKGLEACARKGDSHAHGELSGALASLGG
jgi:tetratricopeptide (TPR) repeat protein